MKYNNKIVENVLQGNKGPQVAMEGKYGKPWMLDWIGQGNLPTKGAMINFDGEKQAAPGSDREYWKMTAFEYANGQQQQQPQQAGGVVQQFVPQNGSQQNYQPVPQQNYQQQNYQQQNGSQQNYQPAPQQNGGMSQKDIDIMLQTIMKSSANPTEADAWLKWFLDTRKHPHNVQQQGVDPKAFPNHTMPLDTAVGDDIPF